jgi:hypothetical protein
MDDLAQVRSNANSVDRLQRYTPFWGLSDGELHRKAWELVCFVYPFCDAKCAHCWSAGTFFGAAAAAKWHADFWPKVAPTKLECVRLTGGEPLLHRQISEIIRIIRKNLGPAVPIRILTSARSLVSFATGDAGVTATARAIQRAGLVQDNLEIQMSADEFHGPSMARLAAKKGAPSADSLGLAARNFLLACDLLRRHHPTFGGGRLQIHADSGRLLFHRTHVHSWMDDETWTRAVIASEGLIQAGRSAARVGAAPITSEGPLSLFLFPGAEFFSAPHSRRADRYFCPELSIPVYLDTARANGGAVIAGWWNVIRRVFCGGSTSDVLSLIGGAVR